MQSPDSPVASQTLPPAPDDPTLTTDSGINHLSLPPHIDQDSPHPSRLVWIFAGSQGLRAGWSVCIFYVFYKALTPVLGTIALTIDPNLAKVSMSPGVGFILEIIPFLAILSGVAIVSMLEKRNILDYNLTGPRPAFHFVTGLAVGFAALSVLIGVLKLGGWLQFGAVGLSGPALFKAGALWALTFLTVGLVEEGSFRCYLQFTLTRGLNFWWALAVVVGACLDLVLEGKGNGIYGVYLVAALGLVPCLLLELRKASGSSFWQASWVTSTLFGFIHTSNNGENWIGIFAASMIGFVFCVSVWATGSAWWAIGCHAAWDWAETYFYGAADSGNVAVGHYLTTTPAGPALWSGGTDGPEGSLLVIPVVLLILLAILVLYGRGRRAALHAPVAEPAAG
ncbi:MAG: CPBP family intramembrane glutamic endopeptidase [Terracidiphilus sp.]|jgi:membrane protease YdiL (CAAX protease family)